MGHDITGYNKSGEVIAYARFSMGNHNALLLYSLLDANEYNGGVSGIGDFCTFSKQQIKKALDEFKQLIGKDYSTNPEKDSLTWEQKEIMNFLLNCFETADKEESIRVLFA